MNSITTVDNTTTDALSPLEQMRAKIQDAENEFAKTLRAEFAAIYARVNELDDGISEAYFVKYFDKESLKRCSSAR